MLRIAVLCLLGLWSGILSAQQSPLVSSTDNRQAGIAFADACWVEGFQRDLDFLAAPIKSQGDLEKILASGISTPLELLPAKQKAAFVSSLSFNEKGVTGFRYDVLEANLTVTQAYSLLALFGEQKTLRILKGLKVSTDLDRQIQNSMENSGGGTGGTCNSGDIPYAKCVSRATCESTLSKFICRSTC